LYFEITFFLSAGTYGWNLNKFEEKKEFNHIMEAWKFHNILKHKSGYKIVLCMTNLSAKNAKESSRDCQVQGEPARFK
jgi:hypothetical protein